MGVTLPLFWHDDEPEPVDPPVDMTPYPHVDELVVHPMMLPVRSPFWAAFCAAMRDSHVRIELACGGVGLLSFAMIGLRLVVHWIVR